MYFSDILDQIKSRYQDQSPDLLLEIVAQIRPTKNNPAQAKENLNQFKNRLKENPEVIILLRAYLKALFDKKQSVQIFTESGILTNRGFFPEAFDRVNTFFLPKVYAEKGR